MCPFIRPDAFGVLGIVFENDTDVSFIKPRRAFRMSRLFCHAVSLRIGTGRGTCSSQMMHWQACLCHLVSLLQSAGFRALTSLFSSRATIFAASGRACEEMFLLSD